MQFYILDIPEWDKCECAKLEGTTNEEDQNIRSREFGKTFKDGQKSDMYC